MSFGRRSSPRGPSPAAIAPDDTRIGWAPERWSRDRPPHRAFTRRSSGTPRESTSDAVPTLTTSLSPAPTLGLDTLALRLEVERRVADADLVAADGACRGEHPLHAH